MCELQYYIKMRTIIVFLNNLKFLCQAVTRVLRFLSVSQSRSLFSRKKNQNAGYAMISHRTLNVTQWTVKLYNHLVQSSLQRINKKKASTQEHINNPLHKHTQFLWPYCSVKLEFFLLTTFKTFISIWLYIALNPSIWLQQSLLLRLCTSM